MAPEAREITVGILLGDDRQSVIEALEELSYDETHFLGCTSAPAKGVDMDDPDVPEAVAYEAVASIVKIISIHAEDGVITKRVLIFALGDAIIDLEHAADCIESAMPNVQCVTARFKDHEELDEFMTKTGYERVESGTLHRFDSEEAGNLFDDPGFREHVRGEYPDSGGGSGGGSGDTVQVSKSTMAALARSLDMISGIVSDLSAAIKKFK